MLNLKCIYAFISITYLVNVVLTENTPIVQLKDGQVRGLVQEVHGHKVYFYQGIRYGQAQRFGKPKPVMPWTGVYNATEFRDACVQISNGRLGWLGDYTKTESDDCLFLDVWAPQPMEKANRTVMVWIYGGALTGGTIFTPGFDGRHLVDQGDVVLVGMNYRLGAFGYLYGGVDSAPGNMGLRDQILALQWVQQNIAHFGGDPHKVTIFGESAGSWSVGALVLSPLAKGLFKRAIMQSGSPNALSTFDSASTALARSKAFFHELNCTEDNKIEDSIKCASSKSYKQVVDASLKNHFVFVYGDEAWPISPVEALKKGQFNRDIDIMYGFTSNEGASLVGQFMVPQMMDPKFNFTINSLKEHIVQLMSNNAKLNWTEVADFYVSKLPKQPSQDDFRATLGNVYGDFTLICPAILFAEQIALTCPSSNYYAYRLVTNADHSLPKWMGVPHGSDVGYLFPGDQNGGDSPVERLSGHMIHAWTNFAKSGHPGMMNTTMWTPAITQLNNHSTEHINLDPADYRMVKKFYTEVCNVFWKPKIFV